MRKGFTLFELLLVIVVVVIALTLLYLTTSSIQSCSRETGCMSNLDLMGKIMKVYVLDFGRNVCYPKAQGEEFLVALYHTGLLAEPTTFLCPSTPDTNNDGADLDAVKGFGNSEGPCSYAGRNNANEKIYPRLFRIAKKDVAITTIGADDWGGEENHQNGTYINFLFLDGHSEGIKSPQEDFTRDYWYLYSPLAN